MGGDGNGRSGMFVGEARTPEGLRLYAIGDVHGCDALLAEVHAAVGADLGERPVSDYRVIHIGDYEDRGPNSAGVIEELVEMMAGDERIVCLRGNHEEILLDFLDDPENGGEAFLANGGRATLRSYGVADGTGVFFRRSAYRKLAEGLQAAMPAAHRRFLEALPLSVRFGDYLFVHAGIRPGVPLERQDAEDLIWIRDEFLSDGRDHGFVVVHGHTPASRPEVMPNRINIDTGAVYGGPLTCLVLEEDRHRFL
jgi:serine/threonine protein phosphatase 1